jgi:hypothetical protein
MPETDNNLQAKDIEEYFAVVYAPGRQRRIGRFAENCVELMDSEDAARAAADPARHRYPARVYGPARSSEGFRLYYLVKWLPFTPVEE